ncbi:MAG: YraN family protein [Bacteroidales bacterium]|nr:MAG: YraN family protein [Bacteroidales bacterium]
MKRNELGKVGEEKAVIYLQKKGFKILHRNWRHKAWEIDIIALEKETLVIVEVKSRTHDYIDDPVNAVTGKKQRFLLNAADAFIRENDIDRKIRFDVVAVIFYPEKIEIEHIDNAFYPTLR